MKRGPKPYLDHFATNRICRDCGVEKPISEFYRSGHGDLMRRSYCKLCSNQRTYAYVKKYYRGAIKKRYGFGLATITRLGLRTALLVYDRAKRKCQQCGNEYDLAVHHKNHQGRNLYRAGLEMDNNPDNLVLLCRSCHSKIHSQNAGRAAQEVLRAKREAQSAVNNTGISGDGTR